MPTDVDASTSSTRDLQELMSRYQKADASAVSILIEELSPRLYRFFADQMGSRIDTDEMLQDTWLRIHQARRSYRPGAPVLPWVYAIAGCVRMERYRRRTVLTLLKVDGMSLAEVARATASTVSAVKQEAHRAYERLRGLFEREPSELPMR